LQIEALRRKKWGGVRLQPTVGSKTVWGSVLEFGSMLESLRLVAKIFKDSLTINKGTKCHVVYTAQVNSASEITNLTEVMFTVNETKY